MISKILIIDAGGTISQKLTSDGYLSPVQDDYFSDLKDLKIAADITVKTLARLDSTNLTTALRKEIARIIFENYTSFDGFVITQGTDTMAETACALNYMIQNCGKPIILTGAQLPIFAPGPDGRNNLYYSIKAATMDLGEIAICFGDRILRGVRSIKYNVHSFNAFSSPELAPIAQLGTSIKLGDHRIPRNNNLKPLLFDEWETNIAFIAAVSGGTYNPFTPFLKDKNIKGLVLEGFGAGHIPQEWLNSLGKMVKEGIPVIMITRCLIGGTSLHLYEIGEQSLKTGIIPGENLTREAAGQKLMYALGMAKKNKLKGQPSLDYVRKIFAIPIKRDFDE